MISVEDLWGKLEKIPPDKLEAMSKEEFKSILGVDPIDIPKSERMELARRLRLYKGLKHGKIASLLRMSIRDVYKSIRLEAETRVSKTSVENKTPKEEIDAEVFSKALLLYREGNVKDPGDLILELKIHPDIAEEIFKRIVKYKEMRDIDEKLQKWENLVKRIEVLIKRAEALNIENSSKILEMLEEYEKYIKELQEDVYLINERIEAFNKDINDVEEYVNKLANHVSKLESNVRDYQSKMDQKLKELEGKIESSNKSLENLRLEFRNFKSIYESRMESFKGLSNFEKAINNYTIKLIDIENWVNKLKSLNIVEKVPRIEDEVKALRDAVKANRDEYSKKFGELSEHLKSLIDSHKREIDEKYRNVRNDINEIRLTETSNAIEITNIRSEIKALDNKLKLILNDLDNLIFVGTAIRQEGSNRCTYLREDGHCNGLRIPYSKSGLDMIPETEGNEIVYIINVKKNPLICATCPFYKKKGISFPLPPPFPSFL